MLFRRARTHAHTDTHARTHTQTRTQTQAGWCACGSGACVFLLFLSTLAVTTIKSFFSPSAGCTVGLESLIGAPRTYTHTHTRARAPRVTLTFRSRCVRPSAGRLSLTLRGARSPNALWVLYLGQMKEEMFKLFGPRRIRRPIRSSLANIRKYSVQ